MAEKKTNIIDNIIDFALTTAVSFIIFFGLMFLGAPLWASLVGVAIWGGFTGYRPKLFRKTFKFLYRSED